MNVRNLNVLLIFKFSFLQTLHIFKKVFSAAFDQKKMHRFQYYISAALEILIFKSWTLIIHFIKVKLFLSSLLHVRFIICQDLIKKLFFFRFFFFQFQISQFKYLSNEMTFIILQIFLFVYIKKNFYERSPQEN